MLTRDQEIGRSLRKADPEQRALLDLSLRRRVKDDVIAAVLRLQPEDVAPRREAALDRVAWDLGIHDQGKRARLPEELAALPDNQWPSDFDAPAKPSEDPPNVEAPPPADEASPPAVQSTPQDTSPTVSTPATPPAGPAYERSTPVAGPPPPPVKPPAPAYEPPAPPVNPPSPKPSDDPSAPARPADAARAAPEPPPPVPATRERDRPHRRRGRMWLVVLAGALIGGVLGFALLGGSDDDGESDSPSVPASSAPAPKPRALETLVEGFPGQGTAAIEGTGDDRRLKVSLRNLPPREEAYAVWLYTSLGDARLIKSAVGSTLNVDEPLPADADGYRFVDVSREPIDDNPNHSGASVLRISLADLLSGAQ